MSTLTLNHKSPFVWNSFCLNPRWLSLPFAYFNGPWDTSNSCPPQREGRLVHGPLLCLGHFTPVLSRDYRVSGPFYSSRGPHLRGFVGSLTRTHTPLPLPSGWFMEDWHGESPILVFVEVPPSSRHLSFTYDPTYCSLMSLRFLVGVQNQTLYPGPSRTRPSSLSTCGRALPRWPVPLSHTGPLLRRSSPVSLVLKVENHS